MSATGGGGGTSNDVSLEEMTIDAIVTANGDQPTVGDKIRQLADDPDDPPIIFGWSPLRNLLDLLNDAVAQVNAPVPPFQVPLDEMGLRMALINLVRVPDSAQPIGFTCLPCSGAEGLTTSGRMISLCYHLWIQFQVSAAAQAGVIIFPLAELYVLRPRSVMLDRFNALAPAGGAPLWT